MNNLFKDKKKIILGLITVLVLLTIPLTLILIQHNQDWRKKAFGTGQITLSISPNNTNSNTLYRGNTLPITVNLTTTTQFMIYAAGFDLNYDSSVFEIKDIKCNTQLPNLKDNSSAGNLSMSCYRNGGTGAFIIGNGQTVLGTYQVKVKDTAPAGDYNMIITRIVIPNSLNNSDLSNQSTPTPLTYKIIGSPGNVSPTPPGSVLEIASTSGTTERRVETTYNTSWYYGGRQTVKILQGYDGNILKFAFQVHLVGNNILYAKIIRTDNNNSKEVVVNVNGNEDWVEFPLTNYTIRAGEEYYLYLHREPTLINNQVYWLTLPGDALTTVKNYKITIQPSGETVVPTITPTRIPTPRFNPTPTPTHTPSAPTPTPTTGSNSTLEVKGDKNDPSWVWINANASSYTTNCNSSVAGYVKVNLPAQKISKINLYLKWTSGGGKVYIILQELQENGTSNNVGGDKITYLPSSSGEGWITFNYPSPVSLKNLTYRIYLKRTGTANVQWFSKLLGTGTCNYSRAYQIWMEP